MFCIRCFLYCCSPRILSLPAWEARRPKCEPGPAVCHCKLSRDRSGNLLSGITLAYEQYLWCTLQKRTLHTTAIDKLLRLVSTPWNLVLPHLLMGAPGPWIVGLICFSVPLAVVFPPGAMTVEFREGVMPVLLHDVPTVNLSHWGNGELADMHRLAFWVPSKDLGVFPNMALPELLNVAKIVLATGKPANLPNPCNSATCTYSLKIEGPKFRCKKNPLSEEDMRNFEDMVSRGTICDDPIFVVVDEAEEFSTNITKNSLKLSWAPVENGVCFSNAPWGTMVCSTTLASYDVRISTFQNGTQGIETSVISERVFWSEAAPIDMNVLRHYFGRSNDSDFYKLPEHQHELTADFVRLQAYYIRQAALFHLIGGISLAQHYPDTAPIGLNGNGAYGSPYFEMQNTRNFNTGISEETVESYLRDILISTISLNSLQPAPLWTNTAPVSVLESANV
ncbi:hypothetical protein CPLU01_04203 [Colletotrichum plurivorum]|uniref:Uncharacterized protein n=1 Tax=Colletotrichum plurivorum TaxID=2175906 RepID=A0A8H6KPY9_9PEZI|nr:hypothetical protein CPLU01_04203 [Colletotrichum plurivorum]